MGYIMFRAKEREDMHALLLESLFINKKSPVSFKALVNGQVSQLS